VPLFAKEGRGVPMDVGLGAGDLSGVLLPRVFATFAA
jgi:hypothetical protein